MLFIPRHGARILTASAEVQDAFAPPLLAASVCGFDADTVEISADQYTSFGYMFPEAPEPPHTPDTTRELDALGAAMIDQGAGGNDDSDVPAIITYLGQFIDHDITAGTDDDPDDANGGPNGIGGIDVTPRKRDEVKENVVNLRTGSLDLDSVYGGAAVQGPMADKFSPFLRDPNDPAKMRIGQDDQSKGPRPNLPADSFADLPRLGTLIDDGEISEADILTLADERLRGHFAPGGVIKRHSAVIGDGRNDENLAVASVHLAHLRLHNAMVDQLRETGEMSDQQTLFGAAQEQVRWHHQWLTLNAYLPSICDPAVVEQVLSDEAPVYKRFNETAQRVDPSHMPLPLEFSAAAFRFGHSAARSTYDWNLAFGPGGVFLQEARFQEFQEFSTSGKMNGADVLPANWVVDMERFLNVATDTNPSMRNTKLIDTHVSRPLGELAQAMGHPLLGHLPKRNLRRAQRLAVPTAQGILDVLDAQGIVLPRLRADQIASDEMGVSAGPFAEHTPLWFYILKEAELSAEFIGATRASGLRLGPLGSRIVAEVLVGLVIYGAGTYWTAPTANGDRWHPRDGVQPQAEPIQDYPAMMRAAGLLPTLPLLV